MDVFVQKMMEVKDKIMDKMKENKPIIFYANNARDFQLATHCFVCGNANVVLINGPPPPEGQQGQQGLRLEVLEITSP